jgi:hypothetical protein
VLRFGGVQLASRLKPLTDIFRAATLSLATIRGLSAEPPADVNTLGSRTYRQFESLSLRQFAQSRMFSRRSRGLLSPVAVAFSNSSSGLTTGTTALLFSEAPVSLRTSVLRPFDTVLEIRSFRVTYELQRKEVRPLLSDRREPPISRISSRLCNSWFLSPAAKRALAKACSLFLLPPSQGSNPSASARQCGAQGKCP